MKLGAVLAFLALAPPAPAIAAKDEKLPRCNGRQKRPANLYGTVLPTMPPRNGDSAAASPPSEGVPRGTPSEGGPAPTTNLFPPDGAAAAPGGQDTSRAGMVPPIGAIDPSTGPTAALPTSYGSC